MNALREMAQLSPDVKKAVIQFQIDFRVIHEQVDLLGDYKDIHDLLHQLQFSCYNGILHEATHFPDEEESLDILTDHMLNLENIIDKLKLVASRSGMPKIELRWIDEAEKMENDLNTTISTLDGKKLRNIIGRMNRLLSTHPTRINTLLNHAARDLRLPDLWNALVRICKELNSLNLDPEKVDALQSGVAELYQLNKTLDELVDEHDRWQTLDIELRLIETSVDRDQDQLGMDWFDVKQKGESLYVSVTEDWAKALKSDGDALDEALGGNNPVKVRQRFRSFQRRASNRFYQVDLELKALCGDLRKIGEPLDSVLEIIK
jgi:hypothetical protein